MILVKYVRNILGKRVGTVVALDKDVVGWSQCSPKDRFNKERGVKIAEGRAMYGTKAKPVRVIVHDENVMCVKADLITKEIEIMRERAGRYFKDEK
jgi:hypothetical protein